MKGIEPSLLGASPAIGGKSGESRKASRNDASLLVAELATPTRSRRADDDVIDQLELEDSTGFKNSAGEPQISSRRRWIPARMVVDHDEGICAKGDYWFEDFTRVSQSFVEGSLTDRDHLDEFLLGVEQDHSEGLVREEPLVGTKLRYR